MAMSTIPSIHFAIEFGDEAIVKTLLALYKDMDMRDSATGRTLVHTAVDCENVKVLKMLLFQGADINVFSNANLTPLHLAVANKSTRMVEILLDHGADVNPALNFDDKTPLYMAVELNCPMIVAMLLERGASIRHSTIRNVTVFDVARKTGNTHLCLLLLGYADKQLRLAGS